MLIDSQAKFWTVLVLFCTLKTSAIKLDDIDTQDPKRFCKCKYDLNYDNVSLIKNCEHQFYHPYAFLTELIYQEYDENFTIIKCECVCLTNEELESATGHRELRKVRL